MNVVGLTGGIGSGKTTVAQHFAARGVTVVDTDEISRALTAPGGAALERLRTLFDARYFRPDGAVDRDAMRSLVFADANARERLESVLHPAIREATAQALARARGPYAMLVVPLLFETRGYEGRVSRTLVVDCSEELQVERAMRRSSLGEAAVRAVMAAQWPRWRRLQVADDVIWNGGPEAALAPQCELLHAIYCTIPPNTRRDP